MFIWHFRIHKKHPHFVLRFILKTTLTLVLLLSPFRGRNQHGIICSKLWHSKSAIKLGLKLVLSSQWKINRAYSVPHPRYALKIGGWEICDLQILSFHLSLVSPLCRRRGQRQPLHWLRGAQRAPSMGHLLHRPYSHCPTELKPRDSFTDSSLGTSSSPLYQLKAET